MCESHDQNSDIFFATKVFLYRTEYALGFLPSSIRAQTKQEGTSLQEMLVLLPVGQGYDASMDSESHKGMMTLPH